WFDGGDEVKEMRGVDVADEVMIMVLGWWRRVVASGVVDLIDRLIRSVFGFDRKARRKSFSTMVNGGGGVVTVGRWCMAAGWRTRRQRDGERRVRESDMMGRIDRVIRSIFGFAGKSPPEKFSAGGVVAAAGGRPVVGSGREYYY
nr:hypothetical protein [Tanacetum cinerariifolium]